MAKARCPICKNLFNADDPEASSFLPFCSKRCQLVDLSKWCDGSYGIPVKEDEDEDGKDSVQLPSDE